MAKDGGIERKGRTKGKNLGDAGSKVGIQKMIKSKGGKTQENMKSMGRGLAKVAAQKAG
jgi:hypothetical protein